MGQSQTVFGIGVFLSPQEETFIGIVVGDRVAPLEAFESLGGEYALAYATTAEIFDDWAGALPVLQACAEGFDDVASLALADVTVLPPVEPRQIICAGANYYKHVLDIIVAEARRSLPEGKSAEDMLADGHRFMTQRRDTGQPYAWIKANSALCGPNDDIVRPKDVTRLDWELELAVIIGKPCYRVGRGEALSYVAGYAIGNDISARDFIYREDMKKIGTDWLAAKGRPTFLPLGPYVVPACFVTDPQALTITLKHNGKTMQNESTSDMLFDVARLIEYMSGLVRLSPGDVILTGSPAGNGEHWGVYMQPGDVIESTITGPGLSLGTQRNAVVAE